MEVFMKNWKMASLNSLGVLVYVAIVATIMNHAEAIFGKVDGAVGVTGFLLLFTLSVGVVGSLIIGRPIMLYLDGKKKEAVGLLLATLGCLAILTVLLLTYLGLK